MLWSLLVDWLSVYSLRVCVVETVAGTTGSLSVGDVPETAVVVESVAGTTGCLSVGDAQGAAVAVESVAGTTGVWLGVWLGVFSGPLFGASLLGMEGFRSLVWSLVGATFWSFPAWHGGILGSDFLGGALLVPSWHREFPS